MTGARCTWVCICWAAAAMLAMVLRWFICDIAMATDAGGSPMGSRGWGIIMKGRSNPERREEEVSQVPLNHGRRRWGQSEGYIAPHAGLEDSGLPPVHCSSNNTCLTFVDHVCNAKLTVISVSADFAVKRKQINPWSIDFVAHHRILSTGLLWSNVLMFLGNGEPNVRFPVLVFTNTRSHLVDLAISTPKNLWIKHKKLLVLQLRLKEILFFCI